MTRLHQPRVPGSEPSDGQSAMGRARAVLPGRYYDPAARHAEPPAVTAARQRHQAITAEIQRHQAAVRDTAGPGDDGIGYGWRREYLEGLDE